MRILLADDEAKVRFAMRVLLERQHGLEIVSEAVDADDLLRKVGAACPDIVLLDWELPGMASAALIASCRQVCPGLEVIVLSGRFESKKAALCGGANAFVSKSDPPERLLAALRSQELI